MQKKNRIWTLLILVVTVTFAIYAHSTAYGAGEIDKELKSEIKASIDRGLRFLKDQQEENGSYMHHPGMTALVASAFMRSPRHYTEDDGPFVGNAIKFIVGMAKPDGSIYDRDLPNYNTSVALMVLVQTKNPAYRDLVEGAQRFLMGLQADEDVGYEPGDKMYGGIGYGGDLRPDMSNLQFALTALKDSGVPKDADVWEKAIKFIERCQNRSESNDQPWAGDDGGFVYYPGNSMAGDTKSYGTMTYNGVLSFIHANVDKNDDRVQAAVRWIKDNYTLEENPPIGAQGLYYYYHTMSKALTVYGEPTITDSDGVQHNWYEELARKVMEHQREDGSWLNEEDRWMESVPTLATAYCVLALSIGYPE
ncbi:prenyltransferase/squalene oxidase repeat-containing protein [Candidatus Poribacteria bacterium]